MARSLLILWAGRHRRPAWEELCGDYRQRIEREISVQDQMIKVRTSGHDPGRMRDEGSALLAALPSPCWPIVLDPRAKPSSSEKLARDLRRLHDEWPHAVAFLIGSDLGLDERVIAAARQRLSFGPMVFGHELARLVLYEQIYRSLSIDRGVQYHRS